MKKRPENEKNKNNNSSPLSTRELERIRQLLLHKRQDIVRSQTHLLSELSDPGDRHHLADLEEMASDTNEMDSLCEIMDIDGSTAAQIDAALEKIEEGTYGVCEICEETIPRARLEALPFAGLCIRCQREREVHPEI